MEENKKRCPLLVTASLDHTGRYTLCKEGRCAWWDGCNCAVLSLALNLDDLAERGVDTYPQN